ncbi:hypothetical protein MLD38_013265 [Melastoma candidum]|uniref:Uncharacterized protein n=1 Tax=Melastoma candidum TaxID=119954 RepID=A0ACB9R8M0_9MYRT|nr:hypothetical protein MLD38_013265 [Melastoma candidum]
MGRGKLALELIPKEKSRMLTFEKRKKGLMKKAGEFSTLCGVDTCMIIFGERGTEPEVWPPEKDEVRRIIDRYLSEGPDRRSKRTVGLPDFFINRKKKLDAELKKVRTANWEAKYPVSDEIVEGLSEEQLRSFLNALKGKLDMAKELLATMKAEKLQELARNEMVQYEFYTKDNGMYSDHTMQCPSTFVDVKPGFEFPNGYCHDQHLLPPMPDPSTMYNSFSNEVMTFGAQGNIPYTMVHNDAGPSMLNGFGDHNYPPMPHNFQFPPIHGMPFHEPTFNIPSNMAFSGNVGHCEAMPMQPQMMSGMHFSMVPTDQPNVGTSQASSSMPFSGFPEMLIKGKGKGIA